MSTRSNNLVNPNAREAMNRFKMEAAGEVGVNLKQGYNGDHTSRQAGSVGGQMVKKMIEAYENGMKLAKSEKSGKPPGIGRLFAVSPCIQTRCRRARRCLRP